MKKSVLLCGCLLMFIASPVSGESSKQEEVQKLLHILEDLYQKAVYYEKENYDYKDPEGYLKFTEKVREDVSNILLPTIDLEQLGRLAVITREIYSPGNARDVKFDEVFYQASDECTIKLARTSSQKSYRLLKEIECPLCLDGGESVMFKEMITKLEKRLGKISTNSLVNEFSQQDHFQEVDTDYKKYTDTELQTLIQQALKILDIAPSIEKLFTQSETAQESPKQERIQEFLTILKVLHQIAIYTQKRTYPGTAFEKIIEQTLRHMQEPEELGRLATVAWFIYSFGRTREPKYDRLFYHTYRICIEKLANHPCQDTYLELAHLDQCRLCLKGEEKKFFEEKLNNVKSHLKKAGK